MANGVIVPTMFSTRNEEWHDQATRPIRSVYSSSKVLELEPRMDDTINLLVQGLERVSQHTNGKEIECKMELCMGAFALDSNSNVTIGKEGGFLKSSFDASIAMGTTDKCASVSFVGTENQIGRASCR